MRIQLPVSKSRVIRLLLAACAAVGALGLSALADAATSPPPPTVSTSVTSNVTQGSAVLYGYVNPNGSATSYAFQYGATTAYGHQTPLTSAGSGTTSIRVSQGISGLSAHTTYHYRVIATSPGGNPQGEDRTFTTLSPPPPPARPAPSASTGGVSTSPSSATLFGFVNPKGQYTTYFFQYGTTSGYGAQTALAAAGGGTTSVKVSKAISGLAPFTLYHYRIVAQNASGRVFGSDHSFRTSKLPLSLQIAASQNPVLFGGSFLLSGTLTGTGAAGRDVVLEANPFPYNGGFKALGSAQKTNAQGGFAFPVIGMLENTQLRVQTLGGPRVTSGVLSEFVAVKVTFHVRRTHRHGVYRFYGTVTPSEVGAIVGFQLLRAHHRSVNKGGTTVKAGPGGTSYFSRRVRVRHRGVYKVLVRINDGAHVSNYSNRVRIR